MTHWNTMFYLPAYFLVPSLFNYVCSAGTIDGFYHNQSLSFYNSIYSSKDDIANEDFWRRNGDLLSGKTLKVVIKLASPGTEDIAAGSIMLKNGTTVYLDGGGVPVVWDLRDALNLTLDLYFDYDWDPTWELVANGSADLGSPLRTVQLSLGQNGNMQNVALLYPVLSMTSTVYFRQPPMGSINSIILGPLSHETWCLLVSCWLLCLFGCCTIHAFSGTESTTAAEEQFSGSDFILWAIAIIHGRDYPVHQRIGQKTALRIAMISSMCLSVMALAIYTAKIVAHFSVKNDAVKSPEDLLKYGYTLSSFSHVHVDRVFKNVKNRTKLIETSAGNFVSGGDSMAKLIDSKNPDPRYAFLTHPDGFYSYGRFSNNLTNELCGVSAFSSSIKSARAMYIKKGSEFREIINWQILQLVERGLNHRHQISLQRKYKFACLHQKQQFEELSLQQTLLTFVILMVGACLSVLIEIVFLVNRLFQSFRKQNQWHKLQRSESTLEYVVSTDD